MKRKLSRSGKLFLSRAGKNQSLRVTPLCPASLPTEPESVLPLTLKLQLQSEITLMLQRVQCLVEQSAAELKAAMNYLRSSILFKEVDEISASLVDDIVGEYARNRIQQLEIQLKEAKQEAKHWREERRQEREFNESAFRTEPSLHKPTETSRLTLLTVKEPPLRPKLLQEQQQTNYSQMLIDLVGCAPTLKEKDRNEMLRFLREGIKQCTQPCCKWADVNIKAKSRPTPNAGSNRSRSYYKSDPVDHYYERYYQPKSGFQLDRVVSLVKTNTQQMDRLYRRQAARQKQMARSHFRNKSIA